jgi:hypothetical protein
MAHETSNLNMLKNCCVGYRMCCVGCRKCCVGQGWTLKLFQLFRRPAALSAPGGLGEMGSGLAKK